MEGEEQDWGDDKKCSISRHHGCVKARKNKLLAARFGRGSDISKFNLIHWDSSKNYKKNCAVPFQLGGDPHPITNGDSLNLRGRSLAIL